MELDATHKALFREIDNIEDENAYTRFFKQIIRTEEHQPISFLEL